jgi:hypothetical protein
MESTASSANAIANTRDLETESSGKAINRVVGLSM